MGGLELNFLGELRVVRNGDPQALPPSKKTRALLAYLALQPRPFRREHLCELLWEVPDDPRGSLRWSLSKLRRLVDEDGRPRIVADRASVAFDAGDVAIDSLALTRLARDGLADASLDTLEQAAARFRGELLEGLDLSGFGNFHAWCMAERQQVAQARSALLAALIERLTDDPERALPHARALVAESPYDEAARARLIRLLVSLRRGQEAEQQYHLGRRVLEEAGIESSGALYASFRGAASSRGGPASTSAPGGDPGRPVSGPLVGRDAELRQLHDAFARVSGRGRAELLLVRGEPGMGKTRLLETLKPLAAEAGALVLEASAFESEAIRPFALWIDALRRLGGDTEAPVFASATGSAAADNRDRLFGALRDLVTAHARERPVMLVLDDVQWCDESSAAALHYVARMNRDAPLFGVLAGRVGELDDNAAVQQALRGLRRDGLLEELRLGGLGEDDIRALVARHAPQADADRLSRQCGGNPLLAIELARAETAGDSGGSLEELIRERLARFDADGREVLAWASILAPRVDTSSLVRVTGLDATRIGAALSQAERQAMLVPDERGFRFSHDLLGRGVYAEVPPARRRMMHRRVAEMLEEETAKDLELAADLAHHAGQSGDSALAARAMVSAGRLCLRFFANDEAANLARRGLALAEQLSAGERVRVELELHDVMLSATPLEDWESAAGRYVALAEQALDHGALAHARLGYHMASYVRWAHGNWTGAREETLQAERVTRGGSDAEHIVGMAETAKCLAMLERDLSHADALLMEARGRAEREGISHHAIPTALGMLRYHENRLDEAEELFKEARTLCKTAGDRVSEFQANEYLVMIAFERGRTAEASRYLDALKDIGERLREGSEAPFARALEGLCHYALQDDTEHLDDALDDLRLADAKYRLAYVLTRAALLDVERGRPATAVTRATEALAAAEVLERATEMMLAHLALAQAHRDLQQVEECRRHTLALGQFDDLPVAAWACQRAAGLLGATPRRTTP